MLTAIEKAAGYFSGHAFDLVHIHVAQFANTFCDLNHKRWLIFLSSMRNRSKVW